ncbi:MAG TPA: hypothetical protein VFD59_21610 [Nocardioidaceae bacterium]|nr:hypothetical protein [Nocardioidaceae bacterium]
MRPEDEFDSFYRSTRDALVLQAYALTGDLPATHSAVRDAYTSAWHHWRKVSALEDPAEWVRPRAWQHALRRQSARCWRRNRSLSAADNAVLAAIADLPMGQRKALLLTGLAGLSLPAAASEMSVSAEILESLLREATDSFAAALHVEPASAPAHLLSLTAAAGEARLPRGSVIRRAGTKRRRSHTVVATAAAAAVAIGAGALAYQVPDVEANDQTPAGSAPTLVIEDKEVAIPSAAELLDEDQITRLGLNRDWDITRTHDNTSGRGINTTCQEDRFADPDGVSALVRTFESEGRPRRSAVQTIEISQSAREADKAFETTVGWYAGCQVGRLQLLTAYRVSQIGDRAQVLMARVWKKPVTTYSVAVARVGRVVTSTVGKAVGTPAASPAEIVQSLDDAVSMLCAKSGASECSQTPAFAQVPPPPSGEERGILAVADLPPIGRINEPWVGTEARRTRGNPSATLCDRADFAGDGARRLRNRTFLIPGARLPDRFGLSETYGVFASPRAAIQFLGAARTRVERCEDRNPAASVQNPRSAHQPKASTDSALWDVRIETSEDESALFRLGFVRVGETVAQVNFSPTATNDMTPKQFEALVVRTGDRLRELGS